MPVDHAIPLALSADNALVGVATLLGAVGGAAVAGLIGALTARSDRKNTWLNFKRGEAHGFMQHIAVHCRAGAVSDEDERLISHYYTLALAVRDDDAAKALYEDLPDEIQQRVHDPRGTPFTNLRSEVTPRRRGALAPPGEAA